MSLLIQKCALIAFSLHWLRTVNGGICVKLNVLRISQKINIDQTKTTSLR